MTDSDLPKIKRNCKRRTDDELAAEALSYTTRGEFRLASPNAYNIAYKRGLLDEICNGHMPIPVRWTVDSLPTEALKYNTRSEFQRRSPSAYCAAWTLGILDTICPHMELVYFYWNDLTLLKAALPYRTRTEFAKRSYKAYQAAVGRGILDFVCHHMAPARYTSKNNVVYFWKAGGLPIYKVGITSVHIGNFRIQEVAEELGIEPSFVQLCHTRKGEARKLEKQLLEIGDPVTWNQQFNGHTEFRKWTSADLAKAKEILANVA